MGTLVTVGYERRDVDELVALLAEQDVDVVVDVRQNAVSRKRGFSKRKLGAALEAAGLRYRHETTLGNPRENRDALRAGDPTARDLYLERLHSEGRDALDLVAELIDGSTVALLCYELEHATCHRTCIAESLGAEMPGLDIVNV